MADESQPISQTQRELTTDQLLQAFYEHPAWQTAFDRTKEHMEREFRRLAIRLASGADVPSGDVQWLRGWYACLKYLLDEPKRAAHRLAREQTKET